MRRGENGGRQRRVKGCGREKGEERGSEERGSKERERAQKRREDKREKRVEREELRARGYKATTLSKYLQ